MMKRLLCSIVIACATLQGWAQNSYLVRTSNQQQGSNKAETPTEQFIRMNFPRYELSEWTPGMKFMVIPERRDLTFPTFCDASTGKEVGNADLKFKIMEYQGYEITEPRGFIHFNFYCEENDKSYYHEVKNTTYADFCAKPKAGVNTLAYLGDVDRARDLLMGHTLYTTAGVYCVDDANAQNGVREITVPTNTPVTVVNIGVGTRACPVKIIVKDKNGREFFQNVCISKTNNGMRDNEFIMDKTRWDFPGSFSFTDPNGKRNESINAQYTGKTIHLKKQSRMNDGTGNMVTMKRLTPFVIQKLEAVNNSNFYTMYLKGKDGKVYTKRITFVSEQVIGDIANNEEGFYPELFDAGDPRKQFPNTSEARWQRICDGKVENGMTKAECQMAMGKPTQIARSKDENREDWIYKDEFRKQQSAILCFTNGVLTAVRY